MKPAVAQEKRPKVYRLDCTVSRRVRYGMRVNYARSITPDRGVIIEHYILSCPERSVED